MELWIRSQDKEDLLNNPLRIYYDSNYEGVHQIKANTYDETICLGIYKTKERALEVLDEIVAYKDKLDEANFLGMTEAIFVSSIYTMPEE